MKSNPICDRHRRISEGFDSATAGGSKYVLCNLKYIDNYYTVKCQWKVWIVESWEKPQSKGYVTSGTQNFSLSHARVIVEKDHLHYNKVIYSASQRRVPVLQWVLLLDL